MAGKASESCTQLLIDWLLLAFRKDKVIIMSEEHQDLSFLFYYHFSGLFKYRVGQKYVSVVNMRNRVYSSSIINFCVIFHREQLETYLCPTLYLKEVILNLKNFQYEALSVIQMTWENGQFTNNLILECFICLVFHCFLLCIKDSHLAYFGRHYNQFSLPKEHNPKNHSEVGKI